MVTLKNEKVWLYDNHKVILDSENNERNITPEQAKAGTMTAEIFATHNESGTADNLKLKFDSLTSHDLTYVGVIQTAKASGLEKFPVPYVLTNCHNSLCAVGGTLNDDDHVFGLTAAKKYGGISVPANQAVIHQYMREMMAGCGKMVLGTDSHTRYGALGCMGIGEGGGEVVKQLLSNTYDMKSPEVIMIYLEGKLRPGVGPQDVSLAIIREVFANGFLKNKVMEFVGPGVNGLSMDFRNGIDIMTTETTCLSSIWITDEKVQEYYQIHQRPEEYKELKPQNVALYDGMVHIDLSKVECMIALPFHPSNAYTIKELQENLDEILEKTEKAAQKQISNPNLKLNLRSKVKDGHLYVDQAEIAGCAGGMYENIQAAKQILQGCELTSEYFALNIYPASTPIYSKMLDDGSAKALTQSGAIIKPAFCGPCFGAGDVPAHDSLSIRHTTRNFPNREGSKPGDGQLASVALMDARSIAATALNGGRLTAATELDFTEPEVTYTFDPLPYKRVYNGFQSPQAKEALKLGPNITEWPEMVALKDDILLKVASVIKDDVTTTDELIPSGDASTYRSNPKKMSEFTLSRRDPQYVSTAKEMLELEEERRLVEKNSKTTLTSELIELISKVAPEKDMSTFVKNTGFGSVVYAVKPGDGSAREQAASCQKVLGGLANIAVEYATKRYRSNLVNWGILPFTADKSVMDQLNRNDYIYIKDIRTQLQNNVKTSDAIVISEDGTTKTIKLYLNDIAPEEKEVLLEGSLINFYKNV
ncbi:hydratase [Candidatus Epulonipiscium viviparus]|uniref:hydratase n=1 Tax=Candidatus Epulonipiscium viviparus TaxID=420336 RepID=UPI00016C085A|nr:hydratase [Candidatus Epulopiscium viviparus]